MVVRAQGPRRAGRRSSLVGGAAGVGVVVKEATRGALARSRARRGALALALLGSSGACGASRAEAPQTAETSDAAVDGALRPVEQRGPIPHDARIVDYTIDARLDAELHRVTGTVRMTWRNRTTRAVEELPFHLYMNAFRAADTAWMREARGGHRGLELAHDDEQAGWGYIDVQAVRRVGDVAPAAPGVHELSERPPVELAWAEGDDPTVMTVALDQPVAPAQQLTVELEFITQLPRVFARTGYAGDFHMLGQWFPKIGVLDTRAGWQNHVFTLNSEFYADFGDYSVTLDVPADMVVGATGVLVERREEAGRQHLRYAAEMVHDFAWAADPDFVERAREWHGVHIKQLLQPERAADADAHFEAQIATLESMERRFGPYPWSTITIVHPPADAKGAGGMEYPTLFTTSNIMTRAPWWPLVGFEERVSGVMTTIHEFGHQYFQGLLASNEHQQPWLDEGLNTMSNTLALIDWVGESPAWIARLGNQRVDTDHLTRLALLGAVDLVPVDASADGYPKLIKAYGGTVYRKTAAVMLTLRNLVGAAAFDRAFRTYVDRFRFRHPRGEDLVATLVEVLGARVVLAEADGEQPRVELDVRDYLQQALHETSRVDFKLETVSNRAAASDDGWHRDEHGALVGGAPPPARAPVSARDDAEVEGVVLVRRVGEFRVPVTVEVTFEDGQVARRVWDGQARYKLYLWPGKRVRRATLDPEGALLLEALTFDNTMVREDVREDEGDGVTRPLGDLVELSQLALLGGLSL